MKRKTIVDVNSIRTNPPVYLNRDEAAAFANLSVRTISYLVTNGHLIVSKIGDRSLIKTTDLMKMIERGTKHRIEPTEMA